MIKIKYKIAIPFMIIIIAIPLAAMLVFNVIMQTYIYRTSTRDLQKAIETTNFVLKQQISNDNMLERPEQKGVSETLLKLRTALKTSKRITNTELILLSRQGKLIYPKTIPEDSFLTDKIIDEVRDIENKKNQTAEKIKIQNKYYFVTRHSGKLLDYKLIYVLSTENVNTLIRIINLVLSAILAAAAIIGIVLSLLTAKGISEPIKLMNSAARIIGQGRFVTVEPERTSQEIYELSNSINSMSRSLEKYDKSQKTFLQNASHELRTPLMSVQGYAEGIISGVFPDYTQAAQIICDESKRLTSLVEQLLVLSRIENDSGRIKLTQIVINDVLREFIQRVNGLAVKSSKELLVTELAGGISVLADEELLSQVIINIVSNSIRFSDKKVEITISKNEENALINISDDGIGIPEGDLPYIFDRFYKGSGGNYGLGLAIAKSAVDAMKGNIEARNGSKGAEFLIAIPLCF